MTDTGYATTSTTLTWPPSPRLAALAGIAAPVVFWTGIVLATVLGWDFLREHGWSIGNADAADVPWPSGTALAEHGWVQSVNFAVSGTLLFVFVRAFRRQLRRSRSGRLAGGLLTLGALALALSALNTDMGGDQPDTWHGWVHMVAFFVLMLSSIAGMVATAVALRGDERWRGFSAGAAVVAVGIPLSVAIPNGVGFYLVLVLLFGWYELAAIRMLRLAREAGSPAR